MRIRPDQLDKHLGSTLLAVYLVTGDEPLLMQESLDAIRSAARGKGFEEREVFEVGSGFDWQQLLAAGRSMSLFSDKKILDLRLPGKPGKEGGQAIIDYCNQASEDTLLLISCGKLDRNALRAKWVSAIETAGALIQLWPVDRHQLPNWLQHRARQLGLNMDRAAIAVLADRVEGNLLAAAQELEKLHVLAGDKAIGAEAVDSLVASSARYDIFKLIDSALAGKTDIALRMLHSLRAEGAEGIAMMGAISRELRSLYRCAALVASGQAPEQAMSGVWDKRKPLYQQTLKRLNCDQLASLLALAQHIDQCQKGQAEGNGWDMMEQLVCALSGRPLPVQA